jgi:hydrogenase maturation protein HypF
MRHFDQCQPCQIEYENPSDRRFHAQPNACPQCGPHLEFWDQAGQVLAVHDPALQMTAEAIREGKIVAVKGLGGFHLMVDAGNEAAVQRLRQVKHRAEKPLALMYPSLELVKADCVLSKWEEQLLQSPAAPIVLLKRSKILSEIPDRAINPKSKIAPSVAPHNPCLGVMLPYTPLHHLLLAELGFPVVATSGNHADEPLCIDPHEALQKLGGMADAFLIHDRSIAVPVDDSVVRVMADQEMVLRRARGYAPLPVQVLSLSSLLPPSPPLLAVGAQLKNTIAFSINQQGVLSQHLGDLDTVAAFEGFQQTIARFQQLYELHPVAIACDLHPDYRSTQFAQAFAQRTEIPVIPVQHHYAHVLSCMAEHQLYGTALGVAWDGTGYGLDGTIWGGEFLQITPTSFHRVAHFRTFNLPGGETAIKQPRRSAIGLLYELLGEEEFERRSLSPIQAFSVQEQQILYRMLKRQVNTPTTSSMGRLFDAVASIVGLRQTTQFEGQAAMELEFAIGTVQTNASYSFEIEQPTNRESSAPLIVNWESIIRGILIDIDNGIAIDTLSAKFHNTLVEAIVAIAKQIKEQCVILTGGCFQNQYLTERAIQRLRMAGFSPYWHHRIPPNDGGIALGQLMAAARELTGGSH